MPAQIQITVNGMPEQVTPGLSITDLLALLREHDAHLIVEHNGRFVYPRHYKTTRLKAGDQVELINPDFGG